MVYNVHCLLHLHEVVAYHKCSLNDISCFPFENYLQRIKKSVRSNHSRLTQICKRQSELEQCKVPPSKKWLFMKVEANNKDGWFYLRDRSAIARIISKDFESLECDIFNFDHLDNVFNNPYESKRFNIFLVRNVNRSTSRKKLHVDNFIRKAVCVVEQRGFAIFPLLHEVERL